MAPNLKHIKVIGFDADDTLWVNETYFREAETKFAQMLSQFETPNKIDQELFQIEVRNLPLYGYGIKGFVLSMVEMALTELSKKNIVELDDERKDAMVSNLMVILCGDKEATPVVNTGTLNH